MVHVLGKAKQPTKATQPPRRPAASRSASPMEQPATSGSSARPPDRLDAIAGNPRAAIALMLWQRRHHTPEMMATLTQADIDAFQACADYLEIVPEVRIVRPPGAPEMPALPATATRSATAGRPAEGPRPYVLVQLVDQHGNAFMPIENNEEDRRRQEKTAELQRIRDGAVSLGNRVLNAARSENYVLSEVEELVSSFVMLAKAVP